MGHRHRVAAGDPIALKQGKPGVDDDRVHGLGDPDELGGPVQFDQRQAEPLGGLHHDRRDAGDVRATQLDGEAAGAHLGQFGDEAPQTLVVGGQADAGGQDQLASTRSREAMSGTSDTCTQRTGRSRPRSPANPGAHRAGPGRGRAHPAPSETSPHTLDTATTSGK